MGDQLSWPGAGPSRATLRSRAARAARPAAGALGSAGWVDTRGGSRPGPPVTRTGSRTATAAGGPGRVLLVALLVPLALLTVAGLVLLWPAHPDRPVPEQFATPGGGPPVVVTGEVLSVREGLCEGSDTRRCRISTVRLDTAW